MPKKIGKTKCGTHFVLSWSDDNEAGVVDVEVFRGECRLSGEIVLDERKSWELYTRTLTDTSYVWELRQQSDSIGAQPESVGAELVLLQSVEDDTESFIKWTSCKLDSSRVSLDDAVARINRLYEELEGKNTTIESQRKELNAVKSELDNLQMFSSEQESKFKTLEDDLLQKFVQVLNAKKQKIRVLMGEAKAEPS